VDAQARYRPRELGRFGHSPPVRILACLGLHGLAICICFDGVTLKLNQASLTQPGLAVEHYGLMRCRQVRSGSAIQKGGTSAKLENGFFSTTTAGLEAVRHRAEVKIICSRNDGTLWLRGGRSAAVSAGHGSPPRSFRLEIESRRARLGTTGRPGKDWVLAGRSGGFPAARCPQVRRYTRILSGTTRRLPWLRR